MSHRPTIFYILENQTLGSWWIGKMESTLDGYGMPPYRSITQDQLNDKLYEKYHNPNAYLTLVTLNKRWSACYGVERWLSKLEYKISKEPEKYQELEKLLKAGWDDDIETSTLSVLHVLEHNQPVDKIFKKLVSSREGLTRCLNTNKYKTYEDKKKDPDFLKAIGRKKVLRQMEKTKKLPKPETLEKYEIKEDELREIMGPRGIIYKITSPSGKVYVGQTVRSFEKRMQEHRQESSGCTLIRRAIDKYGDEMNYEIIEENVPQEQLDEREIYWIKELNSLAPGGYNCTTGGQFNVVTQEIKDKVRDGLNKSKIDRDGYLGGISKIGNFFYPRIRQNYNEIRLSGGGFHTMEEAIEVLKEYTRDPENFTIIDNRRMRTVGSITKQYNGWRVSYKKIYLGTYETEDKAEEILKEYLKDPKNFPLVKKPIGNVTKIGNKWELRYKHKYLGTYETENEAYDDVERYLKDPENFTKPEIQPNYGSVYPSKKRWVLAYRGKYITSYETEKEARAALEEYKKDPENFKKPQKKIGCLRFDKGKWRLTYKHKHIGNYATEEEAEKVRQTLQSSL
jgi:hypothetical protein